MNLRKRLFLVLGGFFVVMIYLMMSHIPNSDSDPVDQEPIAVRPLAVDTNVKQLESILKAEQTRTPKIVILTYQRCGSSFLGNLFGQNPDAFYVYEPLDSLYTAMYGTAEGWNVPSDITTNPNGSVRILPVEEQLSVSRFLENLLVCNLRELPVEFLSHKYWRIFRGFQIGLADYKACLVSLNITHSCQRYLKNECPMRFGEDEEKQKVCRNALWLAETSPPRLSLPLKKYKRCIKRNFNVIKGSCLSTLEDFCLQSKIRATKTVRGTVDSIAPLLQEHPDLYVINLVRDPRAVALSRMKMHSTRGIYSVDDLTKEAEIYCRTVLRDHTLIKGLKEKFPKRIYPLIYEDFVKKPVSYTEWIYDFVGIPLPNVTKTYMETRTKATRKTWRSRLNQANVTQINRVCSQFFKVFTRKWDRLRSDTHRK